MRTRERLEKLRDWTYKTVCEGREMKAPAANLDMTKILRREPRVFLGYAPRRPDTGVYGETDPLNVTPGIIIAPIMGDARNRDRRNGDDRSVYRPLDFGQSLTIQNVFMVYEDGVRLPGFLDAVEAGLEYPMHLIEEGTEEGLFTLTNWMDDYRDALLSAGGIPGTDLIVNEEQFEYGMMTDGGTISDRRPVFIGMVTVKFQCHADRYNQEIENLLR